MTTAKLSKVSFKAMDTQAQPAAFANNEIDSFDVGVDATAYAKAAAVSTGEVRKAGGPDFRHFTINSKAGAQRRQGPPGGQPGAEPRADRQVRSGRPPWKPVSVMNSHFFVPGQAGYQDNATPAGVAYDPTAAKKSLTDDGYTMGSDGYMQKNGKDLTISFTELSGVKASQNEALQVQNQLKAVGIKVNIDPEPVSKFQSGELLTKHEFGIIAFSWLGTPYPFTSIQQIYGTGEDSNFAQLSMPEVDTLVKQINVETDPAKRAALANQADKIIWQNVHTSRSTSGRRTPGPRRRWPTTAPSGSPAPVWPTSATPSDDALTQTLT